MERAHWFPYTPESEAGKNIIAAFAGNPRWRIECLPGSGIMVVWIEPKGDR